MHAHCQHRLLLLVMVALAALVLAAACGGGSPSAPGEPPEPVRATAERLFEDGAATLTSSISVRFNRQVVLADTRSDLASFFRVVPPTEGQVPPRGIEVTSAGLSPTTSRVIELTTAGLVSDGSTLYVNRRAFEPRGRGEASIAIEADLAESTVLLATTPLRFARPDVMTLSEIAGVTPDDRDATVQRLRLEEHLRKRGNDEGFIEEVLSLYDTMPAAIVSHPKARAALAALRGTFAEPAILSLLTSDNCTGRASAAIVFETPPDYPDLVARITYDEEGRRILWINPKVEGERFELLMPLLAHEAIHCDFEDGLAEEIAATALDTYLYLLLVAVDPGLALEGTLLARTLNIDAVAMVNSGRALPESVGVLEAPGIDNVLAGSSARAGSFAEFVAAGYPDITEFEAPAEPVAQAYVANLAQIAGVPMGSAFDLEYLDALLGLSFPPQLLFDALAALELEPAY
ncbi:MAG: hypothetical protein Kow0010_14830 [Dehalococcoidia bacterium]